MSSFSVALQYRVGLPLLICGELVRNVGLNPDPFPQKWRTCGHFIARRFTIETGQIMILLSSEVEISYRNIYICSFPVLQKTSLPASTATFLIPISSFSHTGVLLGTESVEKSTQCSDCLQLSVSFWASASFSLSAPKATLNFRGAGVVTSFLAELKLRTEPASCVW